jgi:hypothetical protein
MRRNPSEVVDGDSFERCFKNTRCSKLSRDVDVIVICTRIVQPVPVSGCSRCLQNPSPEYSRYHNIRVQVK